MSVFHLQNFLDTIIFIVFKVNNFTDYVKFFSVDVYNSYTNVTHDMRKS